ncbi:MAG: hypothetical protein AAF790_06165 [Planctomycetota bacterium]
MFSPAAMLTGLVLLAASYLLPVGPINASAYTADDAERYRQTADRLHELSGQAGTGSMTPDVQRELRDKQIEFVELTEKLEAAQQQGPWLRRLLFGAGLACVAAGVAGHAVSAARSKASGPKPGSR